MILYSIRGLRPILAPNAMDSLEAVICAAQKTWLMSLKLEASPQDVPTTLRLPSGLRVSASSTTRAPSIEAVVPDVMTVSVPEAARVDPPETGESHNPMPSASRRFWTVTRNEGGTVEKQMMDEPGLSTGCQPAELPVIQRECTRRDLACAEQHILDLSGIHHHQTQHLNPLGCLRGCLRGCRACLDNGLQRRLPNVERLDRESLLNETRGHAGTHRAEADPTNLDLGAGHDLYKSVGKCLRSMRCSYD
jgi:hypothetical protein